MKLEKKTFQLKLDDGDATQGIIRGFASTFGNIDLGDDVVDPGAFKKTLQENKGVVPILADHDPTKQIGWNLRAEETKEGLYVEGKLNLKDPFAVSRFELVKQALEYGAKMGLSIGYGVVKAMPDKDRPSVRRLKELKLYEYSIVTFPMNTSAMVTAAKNWSDVQDLSSAVQEISVWAKTRGISPCDIANALLKLEPQFDSIGDPVKFNQSFDRIMKVLTT